MSYMFCNCGCVVDGRTSMTVVFCDRHRILQPQKHPIKSIDANEIIEHEKREIERLKNGTR